VYEKVFSMQHYAMLRNLIFYDFFSRSEFYCVFFFDYFSDERKTEGGGNDKAFLSQGDMCTERSFEFWGDELAAKIFDYDGEEEAAVQWRKLKWRIGLELQWRKFD
jgi:hypothetical protein